MSIPHYSLFPHSRHIEVVQVAYQPQVTLVHVSAHAATKQHSPDKTEVLTTSTNGPVMPSPTIGTFSRSSTYRPEAQASPTQDPMLPTMTTPSTSRPAPRHQKSKSAPNVRPRHPIQAPSSSASNLGLVSPLNPAPTPLIRRKTVAHKQSETGLVLNATPALEPLPPWSPYHRSNPDAETPTRRARNSTLPDNKQSFGARAVAAGMSPPPSMLDNQHCTWATTETISPTNLMTKEKRGLFKKSRSFGMLRRSTVSNDAQVDTSKASIPSLPKGWHAPALASAAPSTTMTQATNSFGMPQHLPSDLTTPAKHRPHLDLSTSPPPLISPSSSDAWSPKSASPSSPTPAFLNPQTYFLPSPPLPHQSSKISPPLSSAHDPRVYFTTNLTSSRDIHSSLSFRTATPDVDSRSFDSRMLYGASPTASVASVASTPLTRGRTISISANGQPRTPRQHKGLCRLDMPLPPLPRSAPACLPPNRPLPPVPVPVMQQAESHTAATFVQSITSTPTPAPPHATSILPHPPLILSITSTPASASFTAATSTPAIHTLRRAISETPAPAPTLQSYWDTDNESVVDKPKQRPSSMPIWRKVKAGLHLAKRSWEKGMSAGGNGSGTGSGSGSFSA